MKINWFYIFLYLIFNVVKNDALVEVTSVATTSVGDNPVFVKILQSVDRASNDTHLFDITLTLLKSLCLCMGETLKTKEERIAFNGETNSLQAEDDSNDANGKLLELYKKMYNKTCFNLHNELANKIKKTSDLNTDVNTIFDKGNCGKNFEKTTKKGTVVNTLSSQNSTKLNLKHILFNTLIKTKDFHKYNVRKYSLFSRAIPFTPRNLKHSVIVILTLKSVQKKSNRISKISSEAVSESELNNTLYTNSSVEIDIIDAKYSPKEVGSEENESFNVVNECTLLSLYTFLINSENKNLIKVFKILRKNGSIKLYIEITTSNNHTDYSSICCKNGTQIPLCRTDLIKNFETEEDYMSDKSNYVDQMKKNIDNYKNIIAKIKNLVKVYDNNVTQNKNNYTQAYITNVTKMKSEKVGDSKINNLTNLYTDTKVTSDVFAKVKNIHVSTTNHMQSKNKKSKKYTSDKLKRGKITKFLKSRNNKSAKRQFKKEPTVKPSSNEKIKLPNVSSNESWMNSISKEYTSPVTSKSSNLLPVFNKKDDVITTIAINTGKNKNKNNIYNTFNIQFDGNNDKFLNSVLYPHSASNKYMSILSQIQNETETKINNQPLNKQASTVKSEYTTEELENSITSVQNNDYENTVPQLIEVTSDSIIQNLYTNTYHDNKYYSYMNDFKTEQLTNAQNKPLNEETVPYSMTASNNAVKISSMLQQTDLIDNNVLENIDYNPNSITTFSKESVASAYITTTTERTLNTVTQNIRPPSITPKDLDNRVTKIVSHENPEKMYFIKKTIYDNEDKRDAAIGYDNNFLTPNTEVTIGDELITKVTLPITSAPTQNTLDKYVTTTDIISTEATFTKSPDSIFISNPKKATVTINDVIDFEYSTLNWTEVKHNNIIKNKIVEEEYQAQTKPIANLYVRNINKYNQNNTEGTKESTIVNNLNISQMYNSEDNSAISTKSNITSLNMYEKSTNTNKILLYDAITKYPDNDNNSDQDLGTTSTSTHQYLFVSTVNFDNILPSTIENPTHLEEITKPPVLVSEFDNEINNNIDAPMTSPKEHGITSNDVIESVQTHKEKISAGSNVVYSELTTRPKINKKRIIRSTVITPKLQERTTRTILKNSYSNRNFSSETHDLIKNTTQTIDKADQNQSVTPSYLSMQNKDRNITNKVSSPDGNLKNFVKTIKPLHTTLFLIKQNGADTLPLTNFSITSLTQNPHDKTFTPSKETTHNLKGNNYSNMDYSQNFTNTKFESEESIFLDNNKNYKNIIIKKNKLTTSSMDLLTNIAPNSPNNTPAVQSISNIMDEKQRFLDVFDENRTTQVIDNFTKETSNAESSNFETSILLKETTFLVKHGSETNMVNISLLNDLMKTTPLPMFETQTEPLETTIQSLKNTKVVENPSTYFLNNTTYQIPKPTTEEIMESRSDNKNPYYKYSQKLTKITANSTILKLANQVDSNQWNSSQENNLILDNVERQYNNNQNLTTEYEQNRNLEFPLYDVTGSSSIIKQNILNDSLGTQSSILSNTEPVKLSKLADSLNERNQIEYLTSKHGTEITTKTITIRTSDFNISSVNGTDTKSDIKPITKVNIIAIPQTTKYELDDDIKFVRTWTSNLSENEVYSQEENYKNTYDYVTRKPTTNKKIMTKRLFFNELNSIKESTTSKSITMKANNYNNNVIENTSELKTNTLKLSYPNINQTKGNSFTIEKEKHAKTETPISSLQHKITTETNEIIKLNILKNKINMKIKNLSDTKQNTKFHRERNSLENKSDKEKEANILPSGYYNFSTKTYFFNSTSNPTNSFQHLGAAKQFETPEVTTKEFIVNTQISENMGVSLNPYVVNFNISSNLSKNFASDAYTKSQNINVVNIGKEVNYLSLHNTKQSIVEENTSNNDLTVNQKYSNSKPQHNQEIITKSPTLYSYMEQLSSNKIFLNLNSSAISAEKALHANNITENPDYSYTQKRDSDFRTRNTSNFSVQNSEKKKQTVSQINTLESSSQSIYKTWTEKYSLYVTDKPSATIEDLLNIKNSQVAIVTNDLQKAKINDTKTDQKYTDVALTTQTEFNHPSNLKEVDKITVDIIENFITESPISIQTTVTEMDPNILTFESQESWSTQKTNEFDKTTYTSNSKESSDNEKKHSKSLFSTTSATGKKTVITKTPDRDATQMNIESPNHIQPSLVNKIVNVDITTKDEFENLHLDMPMLPEQQTTNNQKEIKVYKEVKTESTPAHILIVTNSNTIKESSKINQMYKSPKSNVTFVQTQMPEVITTDHGQSTSFAMEPFFSLQQLATTELSENTKPLNYNAITIDDSVERANTEKSTLEILKRNPKTLNMSEYNKHASRENIVATEKYMLHNIYKENATSTSMTFMRNKKNLHETNNIGNENTKNISISDITTHELNIENDSLLYTKKIHSTPDRAQSLENVQTTQIIELQLHETSEIMESTTLRSNAVIKIPYSEDNVHISATVKNNEYFSEMLEPMTTESNKQTATYFYNPYGDNISEPQPSSSNISSTIEPYILSPFIEDSVSYITSESVLVPKLKASKNLPEIEMKDDFTLKTNEYEKELTTFNSESNAGIQAETDIVSTTIFNKNKANITTNSKNIDKNIKITNIISKVFNKTNKMYKFTRPNIKIAQTELHEVITGNDDYGESMTFETKPSMILVQKSTGDVSENKILIEDTTKYNDTISNKKQIKMNSLQDFITGITTKKDGLITLQHITIKPDLKSHIEIAKNIRTTNKNKPVITLPYSETYTTSSKINTEGDNIRHRNNVTVNENSNEELKTKVKELNNLNDQTYTLNNLYSNGNYNLQIPISKQNKETMKPFLLNTFDGNATLHPTSRNIITKPILMKIQNKVRTTKDPFVKVTRTHPKFESKLETKLEAIEIPNKIGSLRNDSPRVEKYEETYTRPHILNLLTYSSNENINSENKVLSTTDSYKNKIIITPVNKNTNVFTTTLKPKESKKLVNPISDNKGSTEASEMYSSTRPNVILTQRDLPQVIVGDDNYGESTTVETNPFRVQQFTEPKSLENTIPLSYYTMKIVNTTPNKSQIDVNIPKDVMETTIEEERFMETPTNNIVKSSLNMNKNNQHILTTDKNVKNVYEGYATPKSESDLITLERSTKSQYRPGDYTSVNTENNLIYSQLLYTTTNPTTTNKLTTFMRKTRLNIDKHVVNSNTTTKPHTKEDELLKYIKNNATTKTYTKEDELLKYIKNNATTKPHTKDDEFLKHIKNNATTKPYTKEDELLKYIKNNATTKTYTKEDELLKYIKNNATTKPHTKDDEFLKHIKNNATTKPYTKEDELLKYIKNNATTKPLTIEDELLKHIKNNATTKPHTKDDEFLKHINNNATTKPHTKDDEFLKHIKNNATTKTYTKEDELLKYIKNNATTKPHTKDDEFLKHIKNNATTKPYTKEDELLKYIKNNATTKPHTKDDEFLKHINNNATTKPHSIEDELLKRIKNDATTKPHTKDDEFLKHIKNNATTKPYTKEDELLKYIKNNATTKAHTIEDELLKYIKNNATTKAHTKDDEFLKHIKNNATTKPYTKEDELLKYIKNNATTKPHTKDDEFLKHINNNATTKPHSIEDELLKRIKNDATTKPHTKDDEFLKHIKNNATTKPYTKEDELLKYIKNNATTKAHTIEDELLKYIKNNATTKAHTIEDELLKHIKNNATTKPYTKEDELLKYIKNNATTKPHTIEDELLKHIKNNATTKLQTKEDELLKHIKNNATTKPHTIEDELLKHIKNNATTKPHTIEDELLKHIKNNATTKPYTKEDESLKYIKNNATTKPHAKENELLKHIKNNATTEPDTKEDELLKYIKNNATTKPYTKEDELLKYIKNNATTKPHTKEDELLKYIKNNATTKPHTKEDELLKYIKNNATTKPHTKEDELLKYIKNNATTKPHTKEDELLKYIKNNATTKSYTKEDELLKYIKNNATTKPHTKEDELLKYIKNNATTNTHTKEDELLKHIKNYATTKPYTKEDELLKYIKNNATTKPHTKEDELLKYIKNNATTNTHTKKDELLKHIKNYATAKPYTKEDELLKYIKNNATTKPHTKEDELLKHIKNNATTKPHTKEDELLKYIKNNATTKPHTKEDELLKYIKNNATTKPHTKEDELLKYIKNNATTKPHTKEDELLKYIKNNATTKPHTKEDELLKYIKNNATTKPHTKEDELLKYIKNNATTKPHTIEDELFKHIKNNATTKPHTIEDELFKHIKNNATTKPHTIEDELLKRIKNDATTKPHTKDDEFLKHIKNNATTKPYTKEDELLKHIKNNATTKLQTKEDELLKHIKNNATTKPHTKEDELLKYIKNNATTKPHNIEDELLNYIKNNATTNTHTKEDELLKYIKNNATTKLHTKEDELLKYIKNIHLNDSENKSTTMQLSDLKLRVTNKLMTTTYFRAPTFDDNLNATVFANNISRKIDDFMVTTREYTLPINNIVKINVGSISNINVDAEKKSDLKETTTYAVENENLNVMKVKSFFKNITELNRKEILRSTDTTNTTLLFNAKQNNGKAISTVIPSKLETQMSESFITTDIPKRISQTSTKEIRNGSVNDYTATDLASNKVNLELDSYYNPCTVDNKSLEIDKNKTNNNIRKESYFTTQTMFTPKLSTFINKSTKNGLFVSKDHFNVIQNFTTPLPDVTQTYYTTLAIRNNCEINKKLLTTTINDKINIAVTKNNDIGSKIIDYGYRRHYYSNEKYKKYLNSTSDEKHFRQKYISSTENYQTMLNKAINTDKKTTDNVFKSTSQLHENSSNIDLKNLTKTSSFRIKGKIYSTTKMFDYTTSRTLNIHMPNNLENILRTEQLQNETAKESTIFKRNRKLNKIGIFEEINGLNENLNHQNGDFTNFLKTEQPKKTKADKMRKSVANEVTGSVSRNKVLGTSRKAHNNISNAKVLTITTTAYKFNSLHSSLEKANTTKSSLTKSKMKRKYLKNNEPRTSNIIYRKPSDNLGNKYNNIKEISNIGSSKYSNQMFVPRLYSRMFNTTYTNSNKSEHKSIAFKDEKTVTNHNKTDLKYKITYRSGNINIDRTTDTTGMSYTMSKLNKEKTKVIKYNTYKPTIEEDFSIERAINLIRTNIQVKPPVPFVNTANSIVATKNLSAATNNVLKLNVNKGILLKPALRTKLHPVRIDPPKTPRRITKRLQLGNRHKEIMTLNTQEFFSQRRFVTQKNVAQRLPNIFQHYKPLLINKIMTVTPKQYVIRPKFSKEKAKTAGAAYFKSKPVYSNGEDFYRRDLRMHHRPSGLSWKEKLNFIHQAIQENTVTREPKSQSVIERPLLLPPVERKLRDKVESVRNFFFNSDYIKSSTSSLIFGNEGRFFETSFDLSDDILYDSQPNYYRRNNVDKTQPATTSAPVTIRKKVTDWWLDDMYLKVRLPLPINSNPGMVFPRRHFAKMEEVADLGALFIDDLLDYKEMLDRGELPLERATSREKGQPLCMEQFYRLLGVCRIPEVGRDRLELPQIKNGAMEGEELVVVACRNYFYPIPVKAVDRGRLTPGEIQAQLLHAMVDAGGAPAATKIGLLTSMNRDQWARAREVIIRDENNRTNLDLISRALCILCLDEAGGDRADTDADTNAILRAMHGAGTRYHSANRWFDKTVQLIISSDGTVGMCYEHSAAEGVAVVRLAERALARAEVADRPAPPPALLPAPQAMKWNIPPDVHRTIEQAARDLDRQIADLDFKVYTYRGYGREFMKSCRTSPDVYIQLAMQYAYYKMYGYLVSTYESASLRRFRNGRVDNIRSAHAAALAWAAAMCTAETPPLNDANDDGQKKVSFNLYGEQKKLELFEEAARKQTAVMEANILGRGIDNHLLGLREAARETLGELPEIFTEPTYKKMIEFKLSTSQVATTTEGTFMGYGAVVPDGYGCSYNPKKETVIFCISSFTSSSVTNTEAFRQSLEEALDSMKLMFQNRKIENKI